MFALLNITREPLGVNLKCDPALARDLRQIYPAVRPGYHMNKEHWNTVTLNGGLDKSKISGLIDLSYDLVYSKLPKIEKTRLSAEEKVRYEGI